MTHQSPDNVVHFFNKLISLFRYKKEGRLAPFVQTHRADIIRRDCKHLRMIDKKASGWSGSFGPDWPHCNNPEMVKLYAEERRYITSCHDCPHFCKR